MRSGVILTIESSRCKVSDLLCVMKKLCDLGFNIIRDVTTDVSNHPHKSYEMCNCVEVYLAFNKASDKRVTIDDIKNIFRDYKSPPPNFSNAVCVRNIVIQTCVYPV